MGVTISEFYCTECGQKGIPIARKKGKQREAGHLKKIFCLTCQKETNHVEIKPFGSYTKQDFLEEYELGRFVNGKRVPVAELTGCRKRDCQYNRHGKCWNTNNSAHCPHKVILENPNDETVNLLNRGW